MWISKNETHSTFKQLTHIVLFAKYSLHLLVILDYARGLSLHNEYPIGDQIESASETLLQVLELQDDEILIYTYIDLQFDYFDVIGQTH